MTTTCPACGAESERCYRCSECGRDLVDVDDDDDGSAAPAVLADGGVSRERGRSDNSMERLTIRVPTQQLDGLEQLVDQGVFPNRSEATRAAIRQLLYQNDIVEQRRPLRTDGGERIDSSGGRAAHPRAERFEAADREARDAVRERQARREVESQQREGQAVDQDPDDGRCPGCRGDVLPCLGCLVRGDE
jgi:Arc/MetJ-type ribon-helix-helix transcriptional regulator